MHLHSSHLTGIVYLVPILFVLPDVDTLLGVASGQPMPLLYKIVTGSPGGGFGLLFLIIGIGFFAGIGALTAACKLTRHVLTRFCQLTG